MKFFCVGLFRTGTTTMCEMFARSFPSDHEFRVEDEIDVLVSRISGAITDAEIRAFVRDRDAARPLVMDSCGAHFGILDVLVDEFPEAKFLLTLRSVYAWMNSCVGKLYGDYVGGWGSRAGEFMNSLTFLPGGGLVLEDRSGSKMCLEQMIKAWASINRRIQEVVPAHRLLVLNTEDLAGSTHAIASFCGIEESLLDGCHSNAGQAADFLSCFDAAKLESLVRRHCSELMAERYPGVTLASHASREWSSPAPDREEMARYFTLDEFVPTEFVRTRIPSRSE